MANEPVLSVLLLWHQHQPFYKDALSNHYELPWVRLHASKDYYDMVALLDDFPKIRANFNLVPSLLAQLDDYAQGKVREKCLGLTLKSASDLSFEDKNFILENFFMANWDRMIDPYPRYRELLDKRGRQASSDTVTRTQTYFKEQDWRDLQVWFTLTWFDPYWRTRDDFIRGLFQKGKGFTEEEKAALIQKQLGICGDVVQKHKEVMERGQIEITTTPFYHPILPLLCDTDAARMAMPHTALPQERFSNPEDARLQIQRAIDDHQRRFGRAPKGMWPSEGSVSETVAGLFADCGIDWIATDEAVLAASFGDQPFVREDLYEPYQFQKDGKSIQLFFRDHELSDAIGFVYSSWDPRTAAEDFIKRLHGIRERLRISDGDTPRPHVVPVILDGENCWEYYEQDGALFLRELYGRLSEDPLLQTVRGSDYLAKSPATRTLSKLWSGSWINSNFAIWIGHREDNRAWDLLQRTRRFLTDHIHRHPELSESAEVKLAWEEIYTAEGSDWCWWYGDDHSSANDLTFDYLFRKHLMNVYTLLGAKIPDDLYTAIKTHAQPENIKAPFDFITPKIDGRTTSYYEWQAAGIYQTESGGTGTMHRVQNTIKSIYFGFDLKNMYLRLDLTRPVGDPAVKECLFKLSFSQPSDTLITFSFEGSEPHLSISRGSGIAKTAPGAQLKADKIIEIALPLGLLNADPKFGLSWHVLLERGGSTLERWPLQNPLNIPYPTEEVFANSWVL